MRILIISESDHRGDVAKSLAKKLSGVKRPGEILFVTEDEFELLRDKTCWMDVPDPVGTAK